MDTTTIRPRNGAPGRRTVIAMALAATLGGVSPWALAFQFDSGDPDLKINWDNTLKYSTAWRTKNPDATLTSNPNFDDGDRNFKKGSISNRVDWLSEFDLAYKDVGFRLSGAAWHDSAYLGSNDNPGFAGGAFPNQLSVPYNAFTGATKRIHGQGGELLDAFAYAKFDIGGRPTSVRLGKHALQWGESVFFGANGIAGGMAPVDVVKLQSVPNTQFKEAIRPVPQISGQVQLTPDVSLGAYYQLRWEANRLPAVGSYFSTLDTAINGGEQLLLAGGASPFVNNALRVGDQSARDSGQGGLQIRINKDETDYGLYLIRFHSKSFQQVSNVGFVPTVIPNILALGAGNPCVHAGGNPAISPSTCYLVAPQTYRLAYQEGITALGGSFSHTFGDVNLAGEVSVRNNQDLMSPNAFDASALGAAAANNNSNPGYAVGRTAHANLSALWLVPPSALFNEASVMAEVAWNRVLSITHNPVNGVGTAAIDPNGTRDAWAFRGVFEPSYRQVLPGLDLSVPVGLGFAPRGSRSLAVGPAFPPAGGGDVSIGLNGVYLDAWRFSLSYTHFFGPKDVFMTTSPTGLNAFTYQQSLADRDFIAFSLRTTF